MLEMIADYACNTGEGPIWDPDEKLLYWVDIPTGRLFQYNPANGEHSLALQADCAIGGYTLQKTGGLLLFMAKGAVRLWKNSQLTTLIEELPNELGSRFNDVIADPMGRVYCGTMSSPSHPGRLYRLDIDGSIRTVVEGCACSNGMGFTADRKTMYYIDTPTMRVDQFDYDIDTGELSNRRPFAQTPPDAGYPDGMTVDADGFVWVAKWGGGRVERYDINGKLERTIELPAGQVSCLTFGGDDLGDIYLTTAGGHDKGTHGPGAGALYRTRVEGISGVPEFHSRITLPE